MNEVIEQKSQAKIKNNCSQEENLFFLGNQDIWTLGLYLLWLFSTTFPGSHWPGPNFLTCRWSSSWGRSRSRPASPRPTSSWRAKPLWTRGRAAAWTARRWTPGKILFNLQKATTTARAKLIKPKQIHNFAKQRSSRYETRRAAIPGSPYFLVCNRTWASTFGCSPLRSSHDETVGSA